MFGEVFNPPKCANFYRATTASPRKASIQIQVQNRALFRFGINGGKWVSFFDSGLKLLIKKMVRFRVDAKVPEHDTVVADRAIPTKNSKGE